MRMPIVLTAAAAIVGCWGSTVAAGAESTTAPAGVTLTISTPTPRYRIGERIPVTLSFRNESTLGLRVRLGDRDRSGRVYDVAFQVEGPAGGWCDPLAAHLAGGGVAGGPGGIAKLGRSEQAFDLNEWVRFDQPGRYRVRCSSFRVQYEERRVHGWAVPLESPAIELEIVEADAAFAPGVIAQARAALASPEDDRRREGARLLRFLATPQAVEALVPLLNDRVTGWEATAGLLGARDREHARKTVERAVADADTGVDQWLITAGVELSLPLDEQIPGTQPADPQARAQWWKALRERKEEVRGRLERRALDALDAKRGRALGITAGYLALGRQIDAPQLRPALARSFTDLDPARQQAVLRDGWERAKCAEFEPVLAARAALPPQPEQWEFDGPASLTIRRYAEFQPDKARQIIVGDICAPQPRLSSQAALSIPAGALPADFEQTLRRNLADPAADVQRVVEVADHYVGQALLPDVIARYQQAEGRWACAAQAACLRAWIRHDRSAGLAALERAMALRSETACFESALSDTLRGLWSDQAQALALQYLDDPDVEVVCDLVQLLRREGDGRCVDPLIEKFGRLDPLPGGPDSDADRIRSWILIALTESPRWTLSLQQKQTLRAGLKTTYEQQLYAEQLSRP